MAPKVLISDKLSEAAVQIFRDRGIDVEKIGESHLACLVPAEHPLASRASIGFADLAAYPLIAYRPEVLPGLLLSAIADAENIATIASGRMMNSSVSSSNPKRGENTENRKRSNTNTATLVAVPARKADTTEGA